MRHTCSYSLSTALNHGAYTANGITSYISSSGDATGQHAHGSVLDVIRDEARHFQYMQLWIQFQKTRERQSLILIEALGMIKGQRSKSTNQLNDGDIEESRLISNRQKSITVHKQPLQLFPQTWQRRLDDLGLGDKGTGNGIFTWVQNVT
jgi:hypothetical protein